jgi:hypothetical protein
VVIHRIVVGSDPHCVPDAQPDTELKIVDA